MAKKAKADIRIVILQRGWVVVGRYEQRSESECILTGASVVRIWGTTRGLPQIAIEGPTDKTVLDRSPTIRFHSLTVIATIDCAPSKWEPLCPV
jgi:hypothetical protein